MISIFSFFVYVQEYKFKIIPLVADEVGISVINISL